MWLCVCPGERAGRGVVLLSSSGPIKIHILMQKQALQTVKLKVNDSLWSTLKLYASKRLHICWQSRVLVVLRCGTVCWSVQDLEFQHQSCLEYGSVCISWRCALIGDHPCYAANPLCPFSAPPLFSGQNSVEQNVRKLVVAFSAAVVQARRSAVSVCLNSLYWNSPCCCSSGKSFWWVRWVNCCSFKNAASNLRIAYGE